MSNQQTKDQMNPGAEPPKLREGWSVFEELKNGARVEIFWPKDKTDDSFCLFFRNKEGMETKLGLSGEAMQAVVMLYASALRYQTDESPLLTWKVMFKDGELIEVEKK